MDLKQEVATSTILEGLHNCIGADQQAEAALASLLGALSGQGNGNLVDSAILVPGRPVKPAQGPTDKQILATLAGAMRTVLQGQRLSMLAIGNMLDTQNRSALPFKSWTCGDLTHRHKSKVYYVDTEDFLEHGRREARFRQENQDSGKLGDEGGSQSPDLKQSHHDSGSGPQGSKRHGSSVTTRTGVNPLSGNRENDS